MKRYSPLSHLARVVPTLFLLAILVAACQPIRPEAATSSQTQTAAATDASAAASTTVTTTAATTATVAVSAAPVDIAQLYAAALQDAKVAEPSEIVTTLTAITPDNPELNWQNDRVLVVTWTSWNGYDNLVGQETKLGREVWVTATPQLQTFCQSYSATPTVPLTLRLEQLLGLPANNGKTRFVQMWVNPADMLRPSPDGEVDDTAAELEMPGPERFPSQQDYEFHRDWFNLQMSLQAYDDPSKGYPWTRLGYTYDWGNPESEVGLSEFVVAAGSTVAIEQVAKLDGYCAP